MNLYFTETEASTIKMKRYNEDKELRRNIKVEPIK
jgi:hypothetical protein